jgi:hypothetical protein
MKPESKSLKIPHAVTHGAGAYALGEVFRLFIFLGESEESYGMYKKKARSLGHRFL